MLKTLLLSLIFAQGYTGEDDEKGYCSVEIREREDSKLYITFPKCEGCHTNFILVIDDFHLEQIED